MTPFGVKELFGLNTPVAYLQDTVLFEGKEEKKNDSIDFL